MPTAIVTGSGGLVGSESVRHFVEVGYDVVGLDNECGPGSSARRRRRSPCRTRWQNGTPSSNSIDLDIRDAAAVDLLFARHAKDLSLVVHTAAQPSHDWAASDPTTDFTVNANGTLNLLEATRKHAPDATFVNMSTNKVYGDLANICL